MKMLAKRCNKNNPQPETRVMGRQERESSMPCFCCVQSNHAWLTFATADPLDTRCKRGDQGKRSINAI